MKHTAVRTAVALLGLHIWLLGCLRGGENGADILALPLVEPPKYLFTRPDFTATAEQQNAVRDEALKIIGRARQHLWIWAYGFNEPGIIEALSRARRRGINIEVVGSPDQDYGPLRAIGIEPALRTSSGLQHTKILFNDRGELLFGTGNFTTSGLFRNNNGFVSLQAPPAEAAKLRRILADEKRLPSELPELAQDVRILLGPLLGNAIQTTIVDAILSAQNNIAFLSFSHSDPVISAALALRAARGILVEGVYDDVGESGGLKGEGARLNSALGLTGALIYLEGNRMGVRTESGFQSGGKLHHKTLIIDDQRVLTGSYNWSLSARDRNMELLAELRSPQAVLAFREEFARIRSLAQLQGRSFQPPAAGPVFWDDTSLCTNHLATTTVFVGRGPYRRGFHFSEDRPCHAFGDAARPSAGLRDLLPFSGEITGLTVDLQEALVPPAEEPFAQRPCKNPSECFPVAIISANPDDGWVELADRKLLPRGWRLSRAGLVPVSFTQVDNAGFYRTTPWQGDALFFWSRTGGGFYVGCAQSGAALDRIVESWLQHQLAFGGRPPRCTPVD